MSISLHNWLGNLFQFGTRRRGTARRKSLQRSTAVEGLENRALLSAANTLAAPPDAQAVCIEQHNHVTSAHGKHGQLAQDSNIESDVPHEKIASLKQHLDQNAKQKINSNFAGDWNLGLYGEQPSEHTVMHVEQKGKKVFGTISQEGSGEIAVLTGKVKKGELIGDLVVNGVNGIAKMDVHKTSNDEFLGTISIDIPGQGPQTGTVLGLR